MTRIKRQYVSAGYIELRDNHEGIIIHKHHGVVARLQPIIEGAHIHKVIIHKEEHFNKFYHFNSDELSDMINFMVDELRREGIEGIPRVGLSAPKR